jgi:hypothetical protein
MNHKIIPTLAAIIALYASSVSAEEPKQDEKVMVMGNSHIVGLKYKLKSKKFRESLGNRYDNYILEDSLPNTPDRPINRKSCYIYNYCDRVAYGGRDIHSMRKQLPGFIDEMRKFRSNKVIVFEGANSLANREFKSIRTDLAYIVDNLHKSGAKVYVAELPLGVIGHSKRHSEERVKRYNSLIKEVGADGIVQLADTPWYSGRIHGYKQNTFPHILERFDQAVYGKTRSPAHTHAHMKIPKRNEKK